MQATTCELGGKEKLPSRLHACSLAAALPQDSLPDVDGGASSHVEAADADLRLCQ